MILRVKSWRILEQVPDSGKEPEFSVIVADPDLSTRPILLKVPYSGMTDTTIDPASHDLYVDPDNVRSNAPRSAKEHVFFRKKTETDEGGAAQRSSFNNTPIGAILGDRVGSRRKAIIDDTTGASVTVSQNAVAMGAVGQELIVGKEGVLMNSGSPKIPDLFSEDHILAKETGLLRFLPKCFIPPFSVPDYLPNLKFLTQIAGTVAIFKAIREATKRGL